MKYLITSIKDIEDLITPNPDLSYRESFFIKFKFPKSELILRECCEFYELEIVGEDFEKFPISYMNYNNKNKNHLFGGLNLNLLCNNLDLDIFKIELLEFIENNKKIFLDDIKSRLYSSKNEAIFKLIFKKRVDELSFANEELKRVSIIEHNTIIELIINSFLNSYQNTFDFINEEYKMFIQFKETKVELTSDLNHIPSREEILKKLIDGSNNRIKFESFEKKLVERNFLSEDFDQWNKSSISLVRFYTFCENNKLFKTQHLINAKGIKLLRQLYSFFEGDSIDTPSKRKKITSSEISKEYFFLK